MSIEQASAYQVYLSYCQNTKDLDCLRRTITVELVISRPTIWKLNVLISLLPETDIKVMNRRDISCDFLFIY